MQTPRLNCCQNDKPLQPTKMIFVIKKHVLLICNILVSFPNDTEAQQSRREVPWRPNQWHPGTLTLPLTHHQHEPLPPSPWCQHRHAGHCGPGHHSQLSRLWLHHPSSFKLQPTYRLLWCGKYSPINLGNLSGHCQCLQSQCSKRHRIRMHTSFGYIITQFNIESSPLDIHVAP